jgi:seryl-tRNA synthetase
MIDINQLRTNIDAYKKAAKAKNKTIDFDAILTLDDTRKSSQQEIDELKHQQKQAGKE